MAQRAFAPTLLVTLVVLLALLASPGAPLAAGPEGQLTWAVHISLAPTWFDPAETPGMITPYMVLYALHDALVKPMPGQPRAAALAESWSVSKDGLVYEFVLRKDALFHNGDPVTADDVKFSLRALSRHREQDAEGAGGRGGDAGPEPRAHPAQAALARLPHLLHQRHRGGLDRAAASTWRRSATRDSRRRRSARAPTSSSPSTRGSSWCWRPSSSTGASRRRVKRLVLRVIPDESTRLAALKRGEVDIAYSIRGELAEELQKTAGLTLKPAVIQSPFWLYFPDQWDPKSPWHDRRVRQAASLAIDRPSINQALTLGYSRLSGSIIPTSFEYYWQPPAPVYDRARAAKLLAEAGYPNGFDAGEYYCDVSYANLGEAVVNSLQTVGIRAKLRPLERVAFFSGYSDKKYRNIIQASSGAFGNAATRLEQFVATGGAYVLRRLPRHRRPDAGAGRRHGPEAPRGHAPARSSSSSTRR